MKTDIYYYRIEVIEVNYDRIGFYNDEDYLCGDFLICKNPLPYYLVNEDHTIIALF
jgi:hypothetical protein